MILMRIKSCFTRWSYATIFRISNEDPDTGVYTTSVAMHCSDATGAITYAVCKEKRSWSNEMLKQLSEVTKIISAHFAKNQVMNHVYQSDHTNGAWYADRSDLISEDFMRKWNVSFLQIRQVITWWYIWILKILNILIISMIYSSRDRIKGFLQFHYWCNRRKT